MAPWIIAIIAILAILYAFKGRSRWHSVEAAPDDAIQIGDYCIIDVREFITSNNAPYAQAQNIPLSYLDRQTRQGTPCDKDILFIADSVRSAKMAAGIVKRRAKRHYNFYYKVV
ncbi:hypothetical protein [Tuberibacillus sp. Marseille-P3662]|uniref:hypothetical protein n=1 Tax=Tuberibacillus sp. Marseille-P3662 TaxID=1965358 RepID=UPI000A1CDC6C|nr:hypothetical protein [Tuberibacillus sp. Marseille-P3662]